jgi:hypothetical protein
VPTLPLLSKPADDAEPDGPRIVVAPGGYQWWYFEALDPVADVRVTAILFDGNPFYPQYLRRYAWYRRFPTRFAPPLPLEYPGVMVRVCEKGKVIRRMMRADAPGACRPLDGAVRVGGDGFSTMPDGALRLTIAGVVDLTFRPKQASAPPPYVQQLACGTSVLEPHGWVIANPLCAVEGQVTVDDRAMQFNGLGYQDHNFGAEPVHLATRRGFWACAWLDDAAHVVAEVVPRRGQSWGVRLIGSTAIGSATWNARTALRVPYPTMIDFGDDLRLDEPRVIESTPVLVQLRYRARVGDVTTTALAHVVEPGRAAWPIVGRFFEWMIIGGRSR